MPSATVISFTDDRIARLPFASKKPEWFRDKRMSSLMLCVSKSRKVFRFESEHRHHNVRTSISRSLGHHPVTKTADARKMAQAWQGRSASGEVVGQRASVTFHVAFGEYVMHLVRKAAAAGKPATWARDAEVFYRKNMEQQFGHRTLADLSDNPGEVALWHRRLAARSQSTA